MNLKYNNALKKLLKISQNLGVPNKHIFSMNRIPNGAIKSITLKDKKQKN